MYEGATKVPVVSMPGLIAEHGLPDYCKIDIEGYDIVAVRWLATVDGRPRYISVESECLSDVAADASQSDPLQTLDALRAAGYTRFKLVDQRSLTVLRPGRQFYRNLLGAPKRVDERLLQQLRRMRVRARQRRTFPLGVTGPWGPDLAGDWLDGDVASEMLVQQRRDYFTTRTATPYGFWCDWHATC
jgi:hypothetical protein